ncbi:MAG TPA: hypothetical protein VF304_16170 [Casimicrobiaceae bacterium]
MRKALAVLAILFCSTTPAFGQVSFAFDSPGVSIGFNVPVYPQLVRIPGYPIYYAPQLDANFFFYDGLYWVFNDGNWYASAWYNGPWDLVSPDAVPLFILRVPVRYYREPPVFFRGWARNAPPRWGAHWGARWEDQHRGWDRWNRASAPAPAPLPTYQRQFAGNRYPSRGEQRTLESRNYHYQPRDRFAQQHVQRGPVQSAQAPQRQQRSVTAAEGARNAERAPNQNRQAQRSTPPSTAQRFAPPTTAQRATPPTAERRGTPPAMANRAPGTPEQRAAIPRPEQRAATPRPEQRAATPRPEQRAAMPRPEQRAATPRPEQRAETQRPEQRSAPAMARGPAQPPQTQARASQSHGQQGRGQAQAAERGNGNTRAGERKDEHNG